METGSIAAARGLSLRLAIALLAILAAFATMTAAARADDPPEKTIVSLTFDDGGEGQYQLKGLFADFGVHGTFYVNSSMTGTWPRMSWEEVEDLARDGNEIGGHTLTHAKLTEVNRVEAEHQVCDDRDVLLERGFDPLSFAYPFGAFDGQAEEVVDGCGYLSARSFTDGSPPIQGIETLPPADPLATRTVVSAGPETTVADLRGYVEEAEEQGGGWVQFVFHKICRWGWVCDPSVEGAETISLVTMADFLGWLEGRREAGTVVKSVREALGYGTLTEPATPTEVEAEAVGAASVRVSWDAPSTAAGGPAAWYEVTPYVGSTALAPTVVKGVPAATSAIVSDLSAGTPHTFRVRAANVMGSGPASAASNAATPAAAATPFAPAKPLARPASGSALVEWDEPFSEPGTPITGYTVTPYVDGEAQDPVAVDADQTSVLVEGLQDGTAYAFKVAAANEVGTGPDSAASAAVTPRATLFDFITPEVEDLGESLPVELGVKFRASVAGEVTGIRFYKTAANTGTHTGSLWSAGGERLAEVTFSGESASGWQTALFDEPVAIEAGTTYIASYFNPGGHFSTTNAVFGSGPHVNGPLLAPANGAVGGNGVYAYGSSSSFPADPAWNARNYFVDVLFAAGGEEEEETSSPPEAPAKPLARPASGSALVEWDEPFSEPGTPITGYTVTPYVDGEAQDPVAVDADQTSVLVEGLQDGTAYAFKVAAANEVGTGPDSAASAAVTPRATLFDFITPEVEDLGESLPVELGVKFRASVAGEVTGIRFYKTAANTGTHTGSLWSAGGERLAEVTFSGESASGWQTALFDEPVAIEAGTTYIASYFNPGGHFSTTNAVFGSGPHVNGPLLAPANGAVGGNGVYAYGSSSSFPADPAWNARNYFVDVLFAAGGEEEEETSSPPEAPAKPLARPASGSALVEWDEPFSEPGTPITGYTVTPYVDGEAQDPVAVDADQTSVLVEGLQDGTAYAFKVAAANEVGTGPDSAASAAVTPRATLFDFITPEVEDLGESLPVELGVKFRASVAGEVTGIRFYKTAANTGTHTGSLWSAGGERLAEVTFSGESASGWQTALFDEPVAIEAGTTYIASYFNPGGHFSTTNAVFGSGPHVNGPLLAPANGAVGGNGVYAYGSSSSFPADPAWNARNYFVDVLFAAGGEEEEETSSPPEAPAKPLARPASGSALVEWDEPFSEPGTPITGYTVTPYVDGEAQDPVAVDADQTSVLVEGLQDGTAYAFKVAAANEVGTGPDSAASAAVTPRATLFDFITPEVEDLGESLPVELGVKFRASVAGEVTGIRFYKTAANTGTHTGSLWSAGGERLAEVTFSGESASGWQTALFDEPVAIEAGTTYIASYFNPGGHFSTTNAVFGSGPHVNGPLLAPANGAVGGNGVYAYGSSSSFPADPAWNARNYFVDVLFAAGG